MFLCSLEAPSSTSGLVAHEIWEPSLDFSAFVVRPDCSMLGSMSTPVVSRERCLKGDLLNLGAWAFSGISQ